MARAAYRRATDDKAARRAYTVHSVGIGLTWAAGWAPIGAITGWVTAVIVGFPLGVVTANNAVMFGVLGFIGGTIFSAVLSLAESSRSFNQPSLPPLATQCGSH